MSAERLTVTVSTIYALSMPKFTYIQLFAKEGAQATPAVRIRADKIEKGSTLHILKLGNETVGEFNAGSVAGWWIQDEEGQKATF